MRYVGEGEVAQDIRELGFPSINACNAIIYVTNQGLFGYHSYGGSTPATWNARAPAFAGFVAAAGGNDVRGTRLYSVTFVGRRGYGGDGGWKDEMLAYATALGFNGKIRGVDLGNTIRDPAKSAYVGANRSGEKCELFCEPWSDTIITPNAQVAANPSMHRRIVNRAGGPIVENMTSMVNSQMRPTGLTRVHSTRLRG